MAEAPTTQYTVKAGDTLSGIAAKYGVNQASITGYASGNPNLIKTGEILTIAGVAGPTAPKSTPTGTGGATRTVTAPYESGGKTYYSSVTVPDTSQNNQAQDYLTNYQTQAKDVVQKTGVGGNTSDQSILAQVRGALAPSTPFPTAPNLTQQYTDFRASMGVSDLENNLTNINSQIATIQSSLEAQTAAEEATGGKVPLSVIAGRQSEEQRQAQIKLDSLSLQKGVLVDELNTKYNAINTYMQLSQQDYGNARQAWEDEFSVNSKIYDAVIQQQQFGIGVAQEQQKVAMTNWQTMANLITNGNINISQMSPEQTAYMSKLEIAAGLPVGITSHLSGTYAPGVTAKDLSLASAAPSKKVISSGFRVAGFGPFGAKDQWEIYNPITKTNEAYDNYDDALSAQSSYLMEARTPGGVSSTLPTNEAYSIYSTVMAQ